jgi:lysophospholipase L1-like esterase
MLRARILAAGALRAPVSMPEPAAVHPSSRARRCFEGLGVSVLVLLALISLVELLGRFVPAIARAARDPEIEMLAKARVQPHPFLAYANKPGFSIDERAAGGQQVSHNSMGFRGPEIEWKKPVGVFRIVCLGGSSTYGFGPTSDATTWPARLEARLAEARPSRRFEVVNGGCQGYSTYESLINLAIRMIDLEPDLVIVYHTINDMRVALWHEARRDDTHWRANWPVERPSRLDRMLARTTTYRLLRNLDPEWRMRRSGDMGWYVVVDFGSESWALTPAAEVGFASIRRNLANIVAIAREHQARVLFGLEGTRWSDFERFGTRAAQEEGMRRTLAIVREAGQEHGVPVVDSARVLEDEVDRQRAAGGTDRIFTSEVHLTDEGSDLLARTMAEAILAQGWLD